MKKILPLSALLVLGCGQDPAAQVVKAFVAKLDGGSAPEAWELLSPGTHAVYDSTAAVLRRFGYDESLGALDSLVGGVTPEEFASMDGRDLFLRMVAANPECCDLSGSVRSVEHVSESLSVVVLSTGDGSQEVGVVFSGGRWLVDLTTLSPPSQPER
jgi:hypothetical protein